MDFIYGMFASFFYWMTKYCYIGKVAYLQYFEFVPIVGIDGHFLLMYDAQKLLLAIISKATVEYSKLFYHRPSLPIFGYFTI